jgi:hypothetical protein
MRQGRLGKMQPAACLGQVSSFSEGDQGMEMADFEHALIINHFDDDPQNSLDCLYGIRR